MKVGVIARGDDRGIGVQSWEFARHVPADRVLLVDLQPRRWPIFPKRFPDATLVATKGHDLPEPIVREWLAGLDVVVFVETPYDWRLCDWAREQGVATVCWVNPEFHRDRGGTPSVYWAPSSWRIARLPKGTRLVPVPVPTDRWPDPPKPAEIGSPLRWLHVGGTKATADRNGAQIVMAAARACKQPAVVTMRSQDRTGHPPIRHHGPAKVRRGIGSIPDYWQLYDNHDILLMPRRFGGLCLPALEAAGAGLALVMTDCAPQNRDWPIVGLPWKPAGRITTPAGLLVSADCDVAATAALMDRWAETPELVVEARRRAQEWAHANSWAALAPQIRSELEWAADRP